MSANEKQIGGSHYASKYQHWDFVEKYNIPYLEGCASKYLLRYQKKNGYEDIEKAGHFLEKIGERKIPMKFYIDRAEVLDFLLINNASAGVIDILLSLFSDGNPAGALYAYRKRFEDKVGKQPCTDYASSLQLNLFQVCVEVGAV